MAGYTHKRGPKYSWRNFDAQEALHNLRELPAQLKLRPNSGKLWLDTLFLLFLAAIQFAILPDIFGRFIYVDLLTPWLIINFVQQPPWRATFLLFVGAMAWETHSVAPAGLYICAYWIMANVLHHVKDTLSWRHSTPWLVSFLCGELWIVLFECFVSFTLKESVVANLEFILVQIGRVILSVGFGMMVCQYWLNLMSAEARK